MNISMLIQKLEEIKAAHGDVEVEAEYWCPDCRDVHEGYTKLKMTCYGKAKIYVEHLGGDDNDRPE